jgi:hypothetical protein
MMSAMPPLRKYGYVWVTLGFFLISLAGHWTARRWWPAST